MRILVTGATGFIGGALVGRLLSKGATVRILVREPDSATHLIENGVEVVQGDVTDPGSCGNAMKDIDLVFHCAGVLGGWGKPESLFWNVNFEGTKNMLEAARKADVNRFVHISSCGIFGPLEDGEAADDNHAYNPKNIYEKTKAEAEKLALRYAKEGLNTVILRPEFVYGPGDLHLLPLFRTIRTGKFVFFGGGRSVLHPTYVDDVLDAMMATSSEPEAVGQAFNIAGEKTVTVKEFISEMAKAMGCGIPSMDMPVIVAKAAGILLENTWGLIAKPPLTVSQVGYLSENRAFRIEKAKRMLGSAPRICLEEGMKRTVEWYRQHNMLG